MAAKPKLNVHKFPRPPLLERTNRHLQIKWAGETVVDSPPNESYWVLETTHPPSGNRLTATTAYYVPQSLVQKGFALKQVPNKSSLCEWKGRATYWTLTNEKTKESISNKAWSYEDPTKGFRDIKSYLCFYANGVPWECFVDDEKVQPQEGDFYGGWVTSDLEGPMKGGPGTWGW